VGIFSRPLSEASGSTVDILWWYKPSLYGGLCPIYFFRELGLVALYLCSKFRIFYKPILEEYVSQVEGGPQLLQSCLHVMKNSLPLVVKEMHPFFETPQVYKLL